MGITQFLAHIYTSQKTLVNKGGLGRRELREHPLAHLSLTHWYVRDLDKERLEMQNSLPNLVQPNVSTS